MVELATETEVSASRDLSKFEVFVMLLTFLPSQTTHRNLLSDLHDLSPNTMYHRLNPSKVYQALQSQSSDVM